MKAQTPLSNLFLPRIFKSRHGHGLAVGTYPLTFTGTSGSLSHTTSGSFTILAQVATPTFSPGAGTYTSAQVTISTTTSGASIRYTINGSTPSETAGTLYSGPVMVSTTTTILAIAYKTAMGVRSYSGDTRLMWSGRYGALLGLLQRYSTGSSLRVAHTLGKASETWICGTPFGGSRSSGRPRISEDLRRS